MPSLPAQTISKDGLALVQHFESLRLTAYRDEVRVWTIGYGHTGLQHRDGTVHAGRKVSEAEANALLSYDMRQFEARVSALMFPRALKEHEFSALVAFDFNVGKLHSSTLRKLWLAGEHATAAANQLPLWNKAGGKVLAGLVRRRSAEREMFLGRDWRKFKA
jgi:lysozyme